MEKPLIAVVEDDLGLREFLQELLCDAGYDVHGWPSGLAAFTHLVNAPPTLLILDLQLGDDVEGGWDILTLLRADARTAHVPVILLSGNVEFLLQRAWILETKKHATTLAKPFNVDVLLAQIQQLLSAPSTS